MALRAPARQPPAHGHDGARVSPGYNNEAKKLGVDGRSKMNKAQLQRAVDNKKR